MVSARESVDGAWNGGSMFCLSQYTYLGVDFTNTGAWDVHIKNVLDNGRRKVNQLHSVISNRDINLSARRLLLLVVVRPTLKYGSEVWEARQLR